MILKPVIKKLEPVSRSKAVKSQKVCINTDILTPAYSHLANSVSYGVFKDDSDPSIVPEEIAKTFKASVYSNVCFSGLFGQIITKEANRMYYKLQTVLPDREDYPPILTSEERSQWLALAKEHKLLPAYINENTIKDEKTPSGLAEGTFIIDLEDLAPSLLYIYLSTIRNIREDPGLPKAVIHLVNELGMNFYLAYVFASTIVLSNCGHHIIRLQRQYGAFEQKYSAGYGCYVCTPPTSDQLEEKISIPINMAIGIQRIVNDPKKYDERVAMTCGGYFTCSSVIEKISKIGYEATIQELLDDDIVAAVMSKTDEEAKEHINKAVPYKEAGK